MTTSKVPTVTWEEARVNSGRFGWPVDEDGNRVREYPLQYGEPFTRDTYFGPEDCLRWSNGVTEGWVALDGLRVEWYYPERGE